MASQTQHSVRAAGAAKRGEYPHFEHKLRDLAEVTRDVQEIRAIEGALKRIALGTYGVCVSCGQPIERERLEAYPTANRCAACQRAHEHGHVGTPTLRP